MKKISIILSLLSVLFFNGCIFMTKISYIHSELNDKIYISKKDLYMYKQNIKDEPLYYLFSFKDIKYNDYIDMFPKGTKIKIINVKYEDYFESSSTVYNSEIISEGKYKGKLVNIGYVFEKEIDKNMYWEEVK